MHEKDTEELLSEIREDEDMKLFLARNRQEFRRPLSEYLCDIMEKKQLCTSFREKASIPPDQNCWPWL